MATGFAEIETGLTTHRVHPSANDVASAAGEGSRAAEPELTALLNRILDDSDWIISGFDHVSDASLNATYNGGEALIEGRHIVGTGTFVVACEDNATNHIWLTWTETSDLVTQLGIHLATSDTPPSTPNAKIATVTTSGGSITGNTDERATNRTLAATISTAVQASITTMLNLVGVGALNAGSIASGFGAINIGSDPFTTTGVVRGGTGSGFGIAPTEGTLHVHTATAGSVAARTDGDDLVVENSGTGGISILTPDANQASLFFGSPSDNFGAAISWTFNSGVVALRTAKVGGTLRFGADNDITNLTLSGAAGSELAVFVGDVTVTKDLTVLGGSIYVTEQSAAAGDTGGRGQFWVKDDSPNVPMFTGDTGVDRELESRTREITIHPNGYTVGDVNWGAGSLSNAVGAAGIASFARLGATNDYVTYTFICPYDYTSVNSTLLYCSTDNTTEATLDFRAELNAVGEAVGGIQGTSGGTVNSIAGNSSWFSETPAFDLNTFDISALFASLVAGDLVQIGIRWTATANVAFMGPIKFRYN